MHADRETTPPATREQEGFSLVTVTIKPFRLDAVLAALRPFHLVSMVASEVRGYGRQKGHLELYRGSEYVISFIPKIKIELVAPRSEVEELAEAVRLAARTGRIGDGKLFVQALQGLHSEEAVLPS